MESEKGIKLLPDPQNGSPVTFMQYIPNAYIHNLQNPHVGKPSCREPNIEAFTESIQSTTEALTRYQAFPAAL